MRLLGLIGLLLFAISAPGTRAAAESLYLESSFSSGQGFAVMAGGRCHVFTAAHVVGNQTRVNGYDRRGNFYPLRRVLHAPGFDYSYFVEELQVVNGRTSRPKLRCRAYNPSGNSTDILSGNRRPRLSATRVNGRGGGTTKMDLSLSRADRQRTTFSVLPRSGRSEIVQGDSGTIVFAGREPVGMIVGVDARGAIAIPYSDMHGFLVRAISPLKQRVPVGPSPVRLLQTLPRSDGESVTFVVSFGFEQRILNGVIIDDGGSSGGKALAIIPQLGGVFSNRNGRQLSLRIVRFETTRDDPTMPGARWQGRSCPAYDARRNTPNGCKLGRPESARGAKVTVRGDLARLRSVFFDFR